MSYTVTILNKYIDPETGKLISRPYPEMYTGKTICSYMEPTGSYIDSVPYVEGYPQVATQFMPAKDAEGNTITPAISVSNKWYDRSPYATNHYDYGNLVGAKLMGAFAETLIPFGISFGQFAISNVSQKADERNTISFEVADYTAAFYYLTLAKQMEDQGIEITVVENSSTPAEPSEEPSEEQS